MKPVYSMQISNLNELLLLEIKERVESAIRQYYNGDTINDKFKVILLLDKDTLEGMQNMSGYQIMAENLIKKIETVL